MMNENFHWTFMNEILGVSSYRSSFTNEFVHPSFMFDSFMNDFCRFHSYRSFPDERTKNPAFFRSCSMFVHLWTNECSFVLAVKKSIFMTRTLYRFPLVLKFFWKSIQKFCIFSASSSRCNASTLPLSTDHLHKYNSSQRPQYRPPTCENESADRQRHKVEAVHAYHKSWTCCL